MSMICPKCNNEIPNESMFCMKCGYNFSQVNNEIMQKSEYDGSKKNSARYFIIGGIALVIGIIIGMTLLFLNFNPVDKYIYYFKSDKSNEAIELYNEKIQEDQELAKELADKQNSEIDSIYDKFSDNKLSYEDAQLKLQKYVEYTPSKTHANSIKHKIEELNTSRTAYEEAKEAENNSDIETALKRYKGVIKEDKNYKDAQEKIVELQERYKTQCLKEAENYIQNRQYDEAIANVEKVISCLGSSDELETLKQQYNDLKSERYAKIVVVEKTVTPMDSSNWIFNNYVNNVFDITNNSDKAIKGIEGTLIVNDLFDKEIVKMGCDFTGQIIQPGATCRKTDLVYKCNEYSSNDMKYYNTDFSDLKFSYEISKIVYEDGTVITPEG